jgi:hypothetical protein
MEKRRFVIVIGMHRSGTSLVARVINLLGVDLGPPSSLMEPKPDNPKGFWESRPIAAFNDDLLAEMGGRWDDPPILADGWEEQARFEPWRARARGIIDREFAGAEVAGWKDPRMSILLPFWRSAASLASRNGTDGELAAELWLRYTIGALRNAPNAHVVRYQDFFDDLDATVENLLAAIGGPAPEDSVRRQISEFFDPSLRRHSWGSMPGHLGQAASWVFRSAWPVPPASIDILWDGLRELRGAEDSYSSLARRWEEAKADRVRLEHRLVEMETKVARSANLEERMAILRKALDRHERMGTLLRDRLRSAEAELSELRIELTQRENLLGANS